MSKRISIIPSKAKVQRWGVAKVDRGVKAAATFLSELGSELKKHTWLGVVVALLCLYVFPWQTLGVACVVGMVLIAAKKLPFILWSHDWAKRLVAGEREVPPLKELKPTYKKVLAREELLVKKLPELFIMNGLHVNRRTPLVLNPTPTLDLDFTAFSPRTGFDPDDIKAKAPKIAKGLGCQSVIVRETSPGACEIKFNWSDPLNRKFGLSEQPVAPVGKAGFGVDAAGDVMSLDMDMSTMFIGNPRAGKSNAQDATFIDYVRKGEWINLYVSNPKTNEMAQFKKYEKQQNGRVRIVAYAEGEKGQPHIDLINQFEADMAERNRNMKGKKLTQSTREFPRCMMWMDELLLLPKSVYKDKGDEFSPLRRILSGGPAAMFTVMAGTQLVYSEDLGSVKGLFTQRVVFRLPAPEITETAFFKGAVSQGALCHTLHKTRDRGVGWALNDDGELTKFRAPEVKDHELESALRGITPEGMPTEADPAPAPVVEQLVYFIEAAGTDLVKIGIAAEPANRLRELQTASPHKLSIITTTAGGRELEQRLHRQFASSRATGEWFHRTPELDALIEDVQRGELGDAPTSPMRHPVQWLEQKHIAHREAKPAAVWAPEYLWWEQPKPSAGWR